MDLALHRHQPLAGALRLVPRASSDRLLIDLKEQLRVISAPPPLPAGWHLEVAHQTADHAPFGGDCLVPACTRDEKWLELVVLDVAGKGLAAGTRALMLSGATSGLLGAVPVESMMNALNTYLWRQNWTDGFVTAAFLAVELATGSYQLVTAGHPPLVQFHAGSGRWSLATERGPALGVLEQATWPVEIGTLRKGDAVLLYTDGVVEQPGQDLTTGIDRMLGQAERFVVGGFASGASRLLAQSRGRDRDDCEAVLLWRDASPTSRSSPDSRP